MKKSVIIAVSIVSSVVLIVLFALFVRFLLIPILNIANSQMNGPEILLADSQSPDGKYYLEAYRTSPGATVDFSVKVYIVNGDDKKIIYNAYHESEVQIGWIDDSTVSINGKTLDLSLGEKYDWRKQ